MDSHQLSDFSVTSAGLPYISHPSALTIPSELLGSLKFDIGDSPNSPFSHHFDFDTRSTLSDNQEQHSSTGITTACITAETYSHIHRPASSFDHWEVVAKHCSGSTSSQDPSCSSEMIYVLQELETALMAPDDEDNTLVTPFAGSGKQRTLDHKSRSWSHDPQLSHVIQPHSLIVSNIRQSSEFGHMDNDHMILEEASVQSFPQNNLQQLLIACAKALSENNISYFNKLVKSARSAVSICGEPIQRLGAYMVEALVARKGGSGTNIYHALRCREPAGKDLLSYMHMLYEICPYLKFGYMAANGAIAEACRNEDQIHIIDFQIAQGTQWVTLLQALAARPGGAPSVRITGIDDPVSKYARGQGLEAVGKRLAAISEKFGILVEFHGVPVFAPEVTPDMLDVRPGEALAVNFPLQLHHTPDESVDVNNPRDGLLRMIKSLSPKVTTLVEQESNTNTTPFFNRFVETLDYYLAMFESIDAALPRNSKERINVEQHCLARDIVNIIACEGKDRVERHELLGKWKSRLIMAGFRSYPLSSYVNDVIRGLLRSYSEHYTLVEKDDAMLLGWKHRNLISASAWQ